MHDPLVVAFQIPRPWPRRDSLSPSPQDGRWAMRLHHEHHDPYCSENDCHGNPFPWWKPRSYSSFWVIAGHRWYWPPLVTIWHREPGGRDSGEVCKPSRRVFDERRRKWRHVRVSRWRFHVWHWRVQVHPFQALRRSLLTRCAWCGGRSRKGDYANISHSWDGPRGRWWRGEPGLFHHDCSAVQHAHAKCLCDEPALSYGDYGTCTACGGFRAWHQEPDEADWLLAAIPQGGRITPEARPAIEAVWAERRARKSSDVT